MHLGSEYTIIAGPITDKVYVYEIDFGCLCGVEM